MASTMTPALPPSSSTTFFLPARSFIRQPTDGLPGERQELEPVVGDHPVPELAGHRQDLTPPGRDPADSTISATVSIVSGSFDGGLSTIGLPARDGRRQLVGRQVEREVERGDAGDRPDREAPRDADAVLAVGHQVERDELAGHPLRLLGAEPERQDRPVHLDERVADRLAGLERDQPAELLAAALDARAISRRIRPRS